MHLGHDYHHDHGHGGAGHNSNGNVAQWQTPHLPDGHHHAADHDHGEPDLDLVENAFVDAFPRAPDPTSFLRLAGVPFIGERADGTKLNLLRVEVNHTTDIGTLTPHFGGGGHRYDPLPGGMTSKRQSLSLVYSDGLGLRLLSLAEAKALKDLTPPR